MAEKDQKFDNNHLEQDEFDAFGESDDFSFDDDEQSFQLDDTADVTDVENAEYEFSSDDTIMDESAFSQPSGSFFDKLTAQFKDVDSKKLIIYAIAGIVGIILVLGAIIKMLFPSAPEKAAATQSTLQQPLNMNISTSSATASGLEAGASSLIEGGSAAPSQPISQPTSQPDSEPALQPVALPSQMPIQPVENTQELTIQNTALQKRVEGLEAQVAQLNAQIASNTQLNTSNQAQIASLIKSIDVLQSQVTRVNKAMQTLVSGVSQAGGLTPSANTASYPSNTMQKAPSYYVQAIIPGRAWLKNADGQIITVAQGDPVPGYGTVATIDSQSGMVVTSTGTKFVFGINVQ